MARMFRGFGLLPDFSSGGDPELAQHTNVLNAAIAKAQQIQATIAPLLTKPEGASLAATVNGLESSIANTWDRLKQSTATLAQKQAAVAAAANSPKPNQADYQYSGGAGWYQKAVQDWTTAVNVATNDANDARSYSNDVRSALDSLLSQYNSKVPAAASLVQSVVDAGLKAQAAHVNVGTATDDAHAAQLQTQAFVADQQLQQVKQAAENAVHAASTGGPSPLIIAAIAVPVLGIAIWAMTRKKASVAGYRRRRRSRR